MEVNDSAHKYTPPQSLNFYIPLIVVAVFVVFFFPTFEGLYARWIKWDEGLSHGLLIIGVFLVLLTKTLPWPISAQPRVITITFLLMITLGSLAWFLFHSLNIFILEQLMLLPLLALMVAAIYGWKTALQHRLLLLLPIFAIPIWDQLNDVLVNLSASIVGEMVRAIKMPAMIDGNSIYIPYGHILIADGCSGLRYLVIALAIGYIIGYLNRYDEKRMLVILAVAGLIGLIANWLRIFILILVGYQSEMQSSLMSDHEFFGWILFGLLCLPAIYFAPVVRSNKITENIPAKAPHKTTVAASLLALALGPIFLVTFSTEPQPSPWQDLLPTSLQPADAKRMPIAVLAPLHGHRENATATVQSIQIYIQVDQYQRQNKEDKLFPYIGRLYSSDHWSVDSSYQLSDTPGQLMTLRQKSGMKKIAQLQWFDVGGYRTNALGKAKLLQIPALINGNNLSLIVTLQGECVHSDCRNTISALQNVAAELLAELTARPNANF